MQGSGAFLVYDPLYAANLSSGMLVAASVLAGCAVSSSVPGTSFTADARTMLYHGTAILLVLLYAT